MKFVLILRQEREGCGYAIGCGTKLKPLKATTREAALIEARAEIMDREFYYLSPEGDGMLFSASLVTAVEDGELPIEAMRAEFIQRRTAAKILQQTARDRMEYDRLKKIFEPG